MMRTGRGKALIVAALAVLILTAAVGGTVAWLATEDGPIQNVFTPSKVTCAVNETFEDNVKSDVSIKNTGNTPAYIRAVIVANWCDAGNRVVEPFAVNREHFIGLYGANWVEYDDGYYYYTLPVQPGGYTSYLFTSCEQPDEKPAGADHLEVNIICQAVQSTPAKAVGEAWGVTISENGVTDYLAG